MKLITSLFHRHAPGEPCPHMVDLLQRTADGKASRFGKWYALAHAARCGPCRKFLQGLEAMLERLRGAKEDADPEILERLSKGAWRSEAKD